MAYTPTYVIGDVLPMSIDIVGAFLNALAILAGPIAQLSVIVIVIGLIAVLLGTIFGLIHIPALHARRR
jgi:hypothetical protein